MTRTVLMAAAAMLVATAAAAAPADLPGDPAARRGALPVEGVITNPTWTRLPTAEDLARYYPPQATIAGVNGRAVMTCLVTAEGSVSDCQVVDETPPGLGFGGAAVAMAPLFRMTPRALDGEPVGGARVTIPIRFVIAGEAAPDAQQAAPPAGLSMKMAMSVSWARVNRRA